MCKELKGDKIKTCTQIVLEHKRLAYLMLNPTDLYAHADEYAVVDLASTAGY